MIVVKTLLGAIGALVINLDRAPIHLNALMMDHVFDVPYKLAMKIVKHYIQQGIKELYGVGVRLVFFVTKNCHD